MIWWIGVLFAGGILLILAEFLLPGAVCGIIGVMMLLGSGYLAITEYPDYAVFIVCGEIGATTLGIVLGLFLLSKTGGLTGLTLKNAAPVEEGYVNVVTDASLRGARGTAITVLRPAGTVQIGQRRVDAVSSGGFIDAGAPVVVVEVNGNRVVVEPGTEAG